MEKKVTCKVCNKTFKRLGKHVKSSHGITIEEYNAIYENKANGPDAPDYVDDLSNEEEYEADIEKTDEKINVTTDNDCDFNSSYLSFGVGKIKINDISELTDKQIADIPEHDNNWNYGTHEIDTLEKIAVGMQDGDNIFIFGPTGCGKTGLIKQISALTNTPTMLFQFSQQVKESQLIGEKNIVIDKNTGLQITEFTEGAFTRAYKDGYNIIFDEFTAIPPKIAFRFQGVLDGESLYLTEDDGREVKKHPRTTIFATDNTAGRGDDSGLYVGTNVLNEATLDRFRTVIKTKYPDKATEAKILVDKTGIKSDDAEKMVEVASNVREALYNEECFCTFGTRRLLSWAQKAVRFNDIDKAADVTVLNRLNCDDASFVKNIIQRHFGGDVE